MKYVAVLSVLFAVYLNACGECAHVAPCFSYAPLFAEFSVVDNTSGEGVNDVELRVEGAGSDGACDAGRGVCRIDYTGAGSIQVEISKDGYQTFMQTFEVRKEPDSGGIRCTVEGCLINNIPSTIELVPDP